MANELVKRWKTFSLSEDEAIPILCPNIEGEGSSNDLDFHLLDSLIIVEPFILLAMCRMMEKIWKPIMGMEFRKTGE